jgi:hypothetical protein
MIAIFDTQLKKFGPKKFHFFGPILCFLTDIALILYVSKYMLPKLINHHFILLILKAKSIPASQLSISDSEMFQNMLLSSLSLAFTFILFFNLVIYLLGIKQNKWAVKYINGYCLSAAILSIVELASYLLSGEGINFVTLFTMLSYFIIHRGYFLFKKT